MTNVLTHGAPETRLDHSDVVDSNRIKFAKSAIRALGSRHLIQPGETASAVADDLGVMLTKTMQDFVWKNLAGHTASFDGEYLRFTTGTSFRAAANDDRFLIAANN